MFTDCNNIAQIINDLGFADAELTYIDKGVMNDKYSFTSNGKEYMIRCYPTYRKELANIEWNYMRLFKDHQVKVPLCVAHSEEAEQPYLVYEKLEGKSLDEVYDSMTHDEKETICREIVENYRRMASIKVNGFGSIQPDGTYSHTSWYAFLHESIQKVQYLLGQYHGRAYKHLSQGLDDFLQTLSVETSSLVWSDFSADNIIIGNDLHLSGFIDFEGMLAGDPLLGLGYLMAHTGKSDFTNRMLKKYDKKIHQRTLDFYAVIRYCRLLPYAKEDMPNGSKRMLIPAYLPYSVEQMESFNPKQNWLMRFVCSLKTWMLLFTLSICFICINCIPAQYNEVMEKGRVEIKCDIQGIEQNLDVPVWFSYNDTSMATMKMINDTDLKYLSSLVHAEDGIRDRYVKAVSRLALESNNATANFYSLLWLTLCFVTLGCTARTLYDYIGWECYRDGQDMDKWWPWYLYRPFICVPIASFLLMAAHTSMFSNLFSSQDISTYLVISFLAGFSAMEFLSMLRRISKSIFEGNEYRKE